jgi:hypothetical protein
MKTTQQIIEKLYQSKEWLTEAKLEMRGNDLIMAEGAEMYVDSLLEWVLEEQEEKKELQ